MKQVQSGAETDEQLQHILYDSANWAIVGQQGDVLCFAASLRRAMDRAADLAAGGAVITALSRLPFDNIVVHADQICRLRKVAAGIEVAPIKYSDAWADPPPVKRTRGHRAPGESRPAGEGERAGQKTL